MIAALALIAINAGALLPAGAVVVETRALPRSLRPDRAIDVTFGSYDKHVSTSTTTWSLSLFAAKPVSPGHWRYTADLPGSDTKAGILIHLETEVWTARPRRPSRNTRPKPKSCPPESKPPNPDDRDRPAREAAVRAA